MKKVIPFSFILTFYLLHTHAQNSIDLKQKAIRIEKPDSLHDWIVGYPEQSFVLKRDWDMQILVTGFKPAWTHQDRPDFSKYDPNKK